MDLYTYINHTKLWCVICGVLVFACMYINAAGFLLTVGLTYVLLQYFEPSYCANTTKDATVPQTFFPTSARKVDMITPTDQTDTHTKTPNWRKQGDTATNATNASIVPTNNEYNNGLGASHPIHRTPANHPTPTQRTNLLRALYDEMKK